MSRLKLSSVTSNQSNSTQSAVLNTNFITNLNDSNNNLNNFMNNFNNSNNNLSKNEQQLHTLNTKNYEHNQKTHTLNTYNSKINTVTIYNSKNNNNTDHSHNSNIENSKYQGTVYNRIGASAAIPSAAPTRSPSLSQTSDAVPVEKRELFIPGFMEINNEINLRCISYSILKALLPSLNQSDICGVRFTSSSNITEQLPAIKYPSFIITLAKPELVQLIMRAKKIHNYFSTRDLDISNLNSEIATLLPDRKIFVNETLSPIERLKYITVKETASSLGFKFIWYSSGRFLVRWREGMRAHEVRSETDLHDLIKHHNIRHISHYNDNHLRDKN